MCGRAARRCRASTLGTDEKLPPTAMTWSRAGVPEVSTNDSPDACGPDPSGPGAWTAGSGATVNFQAGPSSALQTFDGGTTNTNVVTFTNNPVTATIIQGATVTDANLILGFVDPDNFLAGKARLDRHLAEQALHEHVATPLGLTTVEAAYGVHQVVSTTMAEGIRLLSVKRGVDPRDFALLAFGGASGLHVSRVARHLQIQQHQDVGPLLDLLDRLASVAGDIDKKALPLHEELEQSDYARIVIRNENLAQSAPRTCKTHGKAGGHHDQGKA